MEIEQQQHQAVAHEQIEGTSTKKYISIAVILGIVTAMEVAIFYIEALKPMLVPLLLILSFFKFILVAMYFMHLRYDNVIFTVMLGAGLTMALGTFVAIWYIVV